MPLQKIEIRNFRCLDHIRLEFDSRQNLIFGPNAAGKTSILESIYTLGSGHSFRTSTTESIIKRGQSELSVVGTIDDAFGLTSVLGISVSKEFRELGLNGSRVSNVSEFASRFPVQVIDPGIHRLIEDGPVRRRRFVDWGSFHVEQGFSDVWRRFNRAMGQRNAALKGKLSQFDIWDTELSLAAEQLTKHRESYLSSLKPYISDIGQQLLGAQLECTYSRGWSQALTFEEALSNARDRDIQRGSTTIGPQRAELLIKLDGMEIKEQISRGQQKLISSVLVLAQQLHRVAKGSRQGCLLLDDPAAELDVDNLGKLFDIISLLPIQLIVTALSPVGLTFLKNPKVFHVERGALNQMA